MVKSLNPENLPDGFDIEVHTERPIIASVKEIVKEQERSIVVDYIFPGFHISDEYLNVRGKQKKFQRLTIESTGFLLESGKPMLPSFGRYLQIPRNCDYKYRVELTGKPTALPDEILVFPAQMAARLPDKKPETEFDDGEHGVYSMDGPYPAKERMVRIDGPIYVDGYRALILHTTPFLYYPKKKKLIGYGNVRITVSLKYTHSDQPDTCSGIPGERKAFGSLFLNPAPGIEERFEIPPGQRFFRVMGPEFLIIYNGDDFAASAQELSDWKNTRAMITEVISVSELSTMENVIVFNNQNADAIEKHLSRRIGPASRLRYVLLLGDTDLIQTKSVGSRATDYFYSIPCTSATAPNTWEPQLLIGRIPVSTWKDAENIIKRIIAYEKQQPPLAQQYFQKLTLVAGRPDGDSDTFGNDRISAMNELYQILDTFPLLYDVERISEIYPTGVVPSAPFVYYNSPEATDRIIEAVNQGRLLISQRGHGNNFRWYDPNLETTELGQITSGASSVFYSINCYTGNFDLQSNVDCFSEAYLKQGAALALIAATDQSNDVINNYFIKALFDGTFGGILPPAGNSISCPVEYGRLADILDYAKAYMALVASTASPIAIPPSHNIYFTPQEIQRLREMYHVIGDPTLELWRAYPLKIQLQVWIFRHTLHILLSNCPSGCTITVWLMGGRFRKKELLTRIRPSSTHMAISCPPGFPGPAGGLHASCLLVCCWAPGYRYTEAKIDC